MKPRLSVLTVLVLVLAACGGDDAGSDTTTTSDDVTTTTSGDVTTTTGGDGETTTTGGDNGEAMDGVHTADTDLGTILVDPDGFTMYIFTNDTDGESTCYDDCAGLWPPVPADTPISSDLDSAIFGSTARTDGTEQLTVNGMPLYLYTPDASPGDTTGQNVGGIWFVVDADGSVIGGPEASTDSSDPADDGMDY